MIFVLSTHSYILVNPSSWLQCIIELPSSSSDIISMLYGVPYYQVWLSSPRNVWLSVYVPFRQIQVVTERQAGRELRGLCMEQGGCRCRRDASWNSSELSLHVPFINSYFINGISFYSYICVIFILCLVREKNLSNEHSIGTRHA